MSEESRTRALHERSIALFGAIGEFMWGYIMGGLR